jgi:ABC-type multidrug transport system permease subunit
MSPQLILVIASLILSWLVFTWLLKIVKTTVSTAIAAAAIVLVLQLFFGIGPDAILETVLNLPQLLKETFTSQ